MGGLEGSGDGDVDVGGLVVGQLGQLGTQLRQVERCDLLVQVLRRGEAGAEGGRFRIEVAVILDGHLVVFRLHSADCFTLRPQMVYPQTPTVGST